MSRTILSVTELTRSIRSTLESRIGDVWVEGEISNLRKQASGHQYFTLKDERAQIACVLFRSASIGFRGNLSDGLQVQVFGRLSVYEQRGQYQLIAEVVQAQGQGSLQAKFEAMKGKLFSEGLFDADRKQPLPRFPTKIAIVTSPTGAAIQDMLNILSRRAPWLEITLYPVRVQGEGAAEEIANAVARLNAWKDSGEMELDLIVVGRGGGSLEDLWAFNEEVLARAIFVSTLPIVSAVGHEIDFTISDLVADLRAPTPSAAAELIVPDEADLRRQLGRYSEQLSSRVRERLGLAKAHLQRAAASSLLRDPMQLIRENAMRLDYLESRLANQMDAQMKSSREAFRALLTALQPERLDDMLSSLRARLEQSRYAFQKSFLIRFQELKNKHAQMQVALRIIGPEATLSRGFTITMNAAGEVIQRLAEAPGSGRIRTRFADGDLDSEVQND